MNLKKIKDDKELIRYDVVESLFGSEGKEGSDYDIQTDLPFDKAKETIEAEFKKRPKSSRTKDGAVWYEKETLGGSYMEGFWYTDENNKVIAVYLRSSMTGLSSKTTENLERAEQVAIKINS